MVATERGLKVIGISFAGYVAHRNACLKIGLQAEIDIFSSYIQKMIAVEWMNLVTDSNTLLIIDDAHTIYHLEEFWMRFKFQAVQSGFCHQQLCGLLATSTYEYTELVAEFKKYSEGDHKKLVLSQTFTDAIWRAMGGHTGLCHLALEELTKASKDWVGDIESEALQFISDGQLTKQLENSRAFASVSYLKELVSLNDLQSILQEVIQNGHIALDAIDNAILTSLLNIGMFNENGSSLSFSCPVVEQFYRKEYIRTFIYPNSAPLLSPEINQQGISQFVFNVLKKLDGSLLRSTYSKSVDGTYIERIYLNEFYCRAWMVMPARLSCDVGTYFGVKGAVDFYLNGQFQWAFELLSIRDGKRLREHSERFQPNKRYGQLKMKNWA
ncbi:5533_t:CDS:2, partial [Paraglomus brasilianum]